MCQYYMLLKAGQDIFERVDGHKWLTEHRMRAIGLEEWALYNVQYYRNLNWKPDPGGL
jgi:hypothetical protein